MICSCDNLLSPDGRTYFKPLPQLAILTHTAILHTKSTPLGKKWRDFLPSWSYLFSVLPSKIAVKMTQSATAQKPEEEVKIEDQGTCVLHETSSTDVNLLLFTSTQAPVLTTPAMSLTQTCQALRVVIWTQEVWPLPPMQCLMKPLARESSLEVRRRPARPCPSWGLNL